MTSTFAKPRQFPLHTQPDTYTYTSTPSHPHQQYHHLYLPPTPLPAYPDDIDDLPYYHSSAITTDAFSLLQQPVSCYSIDDIAKSGTSNPIFDTYHSTPIPFTPTVSSRHGSLVEAADTLDWPQPARMYPTGMGAPQHTIGHKRARSHQRTPSASTITSNGPASPYMPNTSNPHVVNSDFSPRSPTQYPAYPANSALFSKNPNLPTPSHTPTTDPGFLFSPAGYLPSQAAHMPLAYQAMKSFAIDHHNVEELAPEFTHSSRQSMSSYGGNDSPATPQSGAGEPAQNGQYSAPANDYRQINPNVQLFRTESQAYQDELYNPPTTCNPVHSLTAKPSHAPNNYLSPHSNSLVTKRLETANIARSHSPISAVSRERSPFRDGSPLAPVGGWRSPAPVAGTAASMRQQQKEQAEQTELAQHRPQLQREPTKTISPKDALLDYTEQEQPSLFQDSIPAGYKQHTGGTEQWPSSTFVSQPGAAFGNLTTPGQPSFANFRATSADGYTTSDNMGFGPLPPQDQAPVHNPSYMSAYANLGPPIKMESSHLDANPPFPAQLTSMESSISDNGPPPSSQESAINGTSAPRRPSDTRAATGTYTCTYHGCTQRFDSHANLQKHKRDFHRFQQQQQQQRQHQQQPPSQPPSRDGSGTPSASASASPRSSASPAPSSTSGMTSAALLARNSQAGPHKCTRLNPSTNKPCNTIFSRPYDLTRHEDTIHNNRKHKVRCPMCREEKTFSRNDALTRHMRVVHPEVESFGKRRSRGD